MRIAKIKGIITREIKSLWLMIRALLTKIRYIVIGLLSGTVIPNRIPTTNKLTGSRI